MQSRDRSFSLTDLRFFAAPRMMVGSASITARNASFFSLLPGRMIPFQVRRMSTATILRVVGHRQSESYMLSILRPNDGIR